MAVVSHTLLDIVKIVGFRVGNFTGNIQTVSSPDQSTTNMVHTINEVIRKIAQVKGLPMMNGRDVIRTVDDYDTGTVAITKGGTTVTGTGTTWTSDMVGRAIMVGTKSAIFRIASRTSDTVVTLEEAWPFETITAESYVIAQDRYDLPGDFGEFVSIVLEGPDYRTLMIQSPSEIDAIRHNQRTSVVATGGPVNCTVFDKSSSGSWQVELDPFPDDEYQIGIRYKKVPGKLADDNDSIIVPDEDIDLLINGVVAKWNSFTKEGQERAFDVWIESELKMATAFGAKSTSERVTVVPEDVMRAVRSRSLQGGSDTYPYS